MDELTLKSSLSIAQIEENFKDVDFFSGIMTALKEVLEDKKKDPC